MTVTYIFWFNALQLQQSSFSLGRNVTLLGQEIGRGLGLSGQSFLPGQLWLRLEMLWAGQGSPAGVL